MQLEEFYSSVKDADFLIYNSAVDGGLETVEELLGKSGLLADFKAVKEGNVWCTARDLYPVSYTHLDVYKRQALAHPWGIWPVEKAAPVLWAMECTIPKRALENAWPARHWA